MLQSVVPEGCINRDNFGCGVHRSSETVRGLCYKNV